MNLLARFNRTEKTILITAIIFLLMFTYFLYDDSLLFKNLNESANEIIGSIADYKNDVRTKSSDNFSWLPANKAENIHQKDSIYTGENSKASVHLNDGTVIDIQPNSLVTLNIKDGQMNLDLKYGHVTGEVAQNSSIIVISQDKKVTKIESKKKIEISKPHTNKPIETAPEIATIKLLTPDKSAFNKIKKTDPFLLSWKGNGSEITKYVLEISKTTDFSNLILNSTTNLQKQEISQYFDSAKYFWRVKATNIDNKIIAISNTREFTVNQTTSPIIVSPTNLTKLDYTIVGKPEEITSQTTIKWSSAQKFNQYQLQIATDEKFTHLIKNIYVANFQSNTPNIKSGKYFTRVAGSLDVNNQVMSEWSPTVEFNVNLIAKNPQIPPAPILITKEINFLAKTDKRLPAAEQAPIMQWEKADYSLKYKVEISKSKDFTTPKVYVVSKPAAAWSQYKLGEYYFRVYGINEVGVAGPSSEVGKLDVTTNEVVLNPIPDALLKGAPDQTPPPQDMKIEWSQVALAKEYELEIDTSSAFTSPHVFSFKNNTGVVNLKTPGEYFVRVKALDEEKKPIGTYSNTQPARYFFSPLDTPNLAGPNNKVSIFLQKANAPYVWLEWQKIDGAKSYRIEISTKPDFSEKIISKSVTANRYLVSNNVPIGKIYWRVRAELNATTGSNWSEPREFTLFQQENELFVK